MGCLHGFSCGPCSVGTPRPPRQWGSSQFLLSSRRVYLAQRGVSTRLTTSACQPRHDQMGQGPTEPQTGRRTFLLSSGGAGGRVLLSGL